MVQPIDPGREWCDESDVFGQTRDLSGKDKENIAMKEMYVRLMYVRLMWKGELGESWMNEDNLKLMLYSNQHATEPGLLQVEDVTETMMKIFESARQLSQKIPQQMGAILIQGFVWGMLMALLCGVVVKWLF